MSDEGRLLYCSRCETPTRVYEIVIGGPQEPFLDEHSFVGGCCLAPVEPPVEPSGHFRMPTMYRGVAL